MQVKEFSGSNLSLVVTNDSITAVALTIPKRHSGCKSCKKCSKDFHLSILHKLSHYFSSISMLPAVCFQEGVWANALHTRPDSRTQKQHKTLIILVYTNFNS